MKLGNLSQSLPDLISVSFLRFQSSTNIKVMIQLISKCKHKALGLYSLNLPRGILGTRKTSQNCKESVHDEVNQIFFMLRSNYLLV